MIEKLRPLRSRKHLMTVAQMHCANCGMEGFTQAAHTNYGKGMGIKACDSQTFPLCTYCHTWLDQSGQLSKEKRRQLEARLVTKTRQTLIRRFLWPSEVEAAYQRADKYNGTTNA